MGLQVAYLQTTFRIDDLEQITLAEELPGSDEWPIRDLFQRDINHHRVKTQILPWLRDGARIKFLPPIVLALIPRSQATGRSVAEVPPCELSRELRTKAELGVTSVAGRFAFTRDKATESLGTLEWDPATCWLVALDGQHRIASLRLWCTDSTNDAPRNWTVPAIVLAATRQGQSVTRPPTQLDFARSVFVYINTQAKTPSPNRQILLDDSDPHAIITQEIVERAQARGPAAASAGTPTIGLFSWRDADSRFANDCHRLFDIEEIYGCVSALLLPSNQASSDANKALLGTSDDRVIRWIHERHVPLSASDHFRNLIADFLVPALERILVICAPLRKYTELMNVETRRLTEQRGLENGALRLFSSGGSRTGIDQAAISIAAESAARLQAAKAELPLHFREAIGGRAVISGFRRSLEFRDGRAGAPTMPDFLDMYLDGLNERFAEGWLVNDSNEVPGKFLRHITRSHEGKVKNYRFESIPDAGGALCALLAASHLFARFPASFRQLVAEIARKTLFETIRQGYVSELKGELKRRNPSHSPGQVKDEAQRQALRRAHERVDAILHQLDIELK